MPAAGRARMNRDRYSRFWIFRKPGAWAPVAFLCVLLCAAASGCAQRAQEEGFSFHAPEEEDMAEEQASGAAGTPREGIAVRESAGEATESFGEAADGAGEAMESTGEAASCWVHVCGEVNFPGVYEMKEGMRWHEAVEAAGGLSPEADDAAVNLAAPVEDGQKIYIPAQGEESPGGEGEREDGRVNLNTAGPEELMTLKGIGESRAADIIAYREEHGGFASVEELKNISGIGDKTFENLKDAVTVE